MSDFPLIAPVRQHLTEQAIADPYTYTRTALDAHESIAQLAAGTSVAVGVGSRGIGCIQPVVRATLDALTARGAKPFLVPAMGSHGGGTADGQREVLHGYGLADLGAPIFSDMEAVQIGSTAAGMPVFFDRFAAEADAIMVINRIKPHTSFRAKWESGLMKMLAVGLGKRQGAATYHAWGIADAIPAAGEVVMATLPVLGGVAIVENGHHKPAVIEALTAAQLRTREPELLQEAWTHLPTIPLAPLDVLVLREIGKDISGTGMDLNVVGMWRRSGGPVEPAIARLAVLDLTANSHGNGIGVGYADVIPQALRDKIDWQATYTNCLTSANFNGAKVPITLPDMRSTIATALPSLGAADARMVIARNTLDLEQLWVSTALLDDVARAPQLECIGDPRPIQFDATGTLIL